MPAHLRLERRITRDGMVSVEGNLYSVPDTTRRRPVEVHSTADEVCILEDGRVIAIHPVMDGRGQRRIIAGHRTTPPPANSQTQRHGMPPSQSSNAEQQARHRARQQAQDAAQTIRYRRPADRRSRPQRWADAVAELLALQAEYAAWADALPNTLKGTAEALQTIADIDLSELADIEPPRGYGRA